MADKRKGKQRKLVEEKPTKEEYAVAKFLRFSVPTREGKLHGMEVKCFMGNAAVDKLLESKWSASKNKKDPIFTTRAVCVAYMLRLLEKGMFHRAEREKRKKDKDKEKPKKKKSDKEADKEDGANPDEEIRERKGKKDKKSRKEKEGEGTAEETEKKESSEKKEKKEEKEKKKKEKRLKLVMPDQQFFEDGEEVYVWMYDPVNAKTFLIGLLMVLGAIGLCMFPLWPEEVRVGVYYLSLAAAGFVGFILSLVVIRLILFCCIWILTLGKHHFWLLPNLTEDVGFFDSFRPLYKHDMVKREEVMPKEGKKKKKKEEMDKEGESAEDPSKKSKSSDKDDSDEFEVIKKEDIEDTNDKEEDGNAESEDINDEDLEDENDLEDDEDDEDNNDDENLDTEEEDTTEEKKTK